VYISRLCVTDVRHMTQSELTVSDKAKQTAGNVLRQHAFPSPIHTHAEIESVPRIRCAFQKQLEKSTLDKLGLKPQAMQVRRVKYRC